MTIVPISCLITSVACKCESKAYIKRVLKTITMLTKQHRALLKIYLQEHRHV